VKNETVSSWKALSGAGWTDESAAGADRGLFFSKLPPVVKAGAFSTFGFEMEVSASRMAGGDNGNTRSAAILFKKF